MSIMCEFILMRYPEQVNPYRQNIDWWLPGAGRRGEWVGAILGK
jgi:hypothetical protein